MDISKKYEERIAELTRRLADAEESLHAISRGEVDAFVVNTSGGEQVYTLQGTDTIYRKILEEMSEGAITLSSEHIILYCNASFAKFVGGSLETVMGTSFFDYVSPDQFKTVMELISGVMNGDTGTTGEFHLISRDGKEIPVQASANSLPLDGSNATYLVLTDVTEKDALARKTLEVERFSAIGKVAAMVAHDVRGPLNIVSQATEMIEADPDKAPRMLQIIKENTSRALAILSDLRENTCDIELHKIDLNVDILIRNALNEMLIPSTVTTIIDSNGPIIASLDPERMRRVLSNLINNAVEAMPDGGTLRVGVRDKEAGIEIEIADTGTGIPDSVKDRIFELFTSTKAKGTGLGLALCKRVVEAHSGGITFKTEKGKGTTFTVSIPKTR